MDLVMKAMCDSFFFFSLTGCFSFFPPVTAYRTDGSQLLWQIPSRWGQSAWWAVWLGHGLLRPGDPSFQCFPLYIWTTANGQSGSEWAFTSSGSHGGGPLGNTRLSSPGCSFNLWAAVTIQVDGEKSVFPLAATAWNCSCLTWQGIPGYCLGSGGNSGRAWFSKAALV